jgi:crotonobetainyl-CoA:carnitine CoA-transferase CaiB-like acyl-CoA transferase
MAYDQLGLPGKRAGNRTTGSAPRNLYQTQDGRWIAIAGSTQAITERLFRVMERPDLIDDPRFRTNRDRLANVDALDDIVGAWVAAHTRSACMDMLLRAEVAVAPVADFKDLAEDPHLRARKALKELDDPELGRLRMPDVLPRLSETPGEIRHAGLPMGACNDEIYRSILGLGVDDIERLKSEGVI